MTAGRTGPTALVTGGSIAGPAAAWALARAGFQVTLLERAAEPRTAGQNIDIRDSGHGVLRAMGLHDAVAADTTGELGTQFLDRHGRPYAEFPVRPGADGPTAELEILRGDLSRLLLGLTEGQVEHQYGDHVVAVDQDAGADGGVEVQLAGGGRERYDLLVVAEGRGSHTRDLVYGDDVGYRVRDQYLAYGTIERTESDTDWWRWLVAADHRMVGLRPDNKGTIRANLGFLAPDLGLEDLDHAAQMTVLRRRFADVGWEADRVLEGFEKRPEEFYLERNDQVVLPDYARGRVVILGDAAWAGGPTGMGTTLAIVGAYVLAGELDAARQGADLDYRRAFAAYQRVLRPYAEQVQRVPSVAYRAMLPGTPLGLRALRWAQRAAASAPARALTEHAVLSRRGRTFELPRYPLYDDLHDDDNHDGTPRRPVSHPS